MNLIETIHYQIYWSVQMILYFSLKTTSCFSQPRENSLQILHRISLRPPRKDGVMEVWRQGPDLSSDPRETSRTWTQAVAMPGLRVCYAIGFQVHFWKKGPQRRLEEVCWKRELKIKNRGKGSGRREIASSFPCSLSVRVCSEVVCQEILSVMKQSLKRPWKFGGFS